MPTTIEQDVARYEKWLRKQCRVVEDDLDAKHRRMRKRPFDFFRATYFRWANRIEALCPALATAPRVLCIGDVHVENYGTWRDADGRLVWGLNDFDEAAVMPYAFDLVRLATSALLAPRAQTGADTDAIANAVLDGYRAGLRTPQATLPDDGAGWLREHANPTAQSNTTFWQAVDACPDARPPAAVRSALKKALPPGAELQRFAARRQGGGSLGRPRFLAIATWQSGRVVREAKALVPSAWDWAHDKERRSRGLDAAFGRFRSPDPHLHVAAGHVLRRVAPDARKIEMADVEPQGLTTMLLSAMAADLAAVHAASPRAAGIAADLAARPPRWLHEAAAATQQAAEADFAAYVGRHAIVRPAGPR